MKENDRKKGKRENNANGNKAKNKPNNISANGLL